MIRSWRDKFADPGSNAWTLLALIVLVGAALRIMAFTGFVAGDDYNYIARAFQIADGRFDSSVRHWDLRLGVVLPLAQLFRAFGPSLLDVVLVPLLASLAGIVLAYVLGREVFRDPSIALVGALLVAVNPLDVTKATQLFPAMGLAACSVGALVCFIRAERDGRNALFLAAGLLVGLAYLQRITGLYILLPLGLYVLYRRQLRVGYLLVALGVAAGIAFEVAYFVLQDQSPFLRLFAFASVSGGDAAQYWQFYERPGNILMAPLVSLATEQEHGLFYYFLVPAIVWHMRKKLDDSWILLLYVIAVGGYTLWGSASLSSYRPPEPWPRYMSVVTGPAALLTAAWLLSLPSKRIRNLAFAVLIGSSLACVYIDTSRLPRTAGDDLARFIRSTERGQVAMSGDAYMTAFLAGGFHVPENVDVFPAGGSRNAQLIDPDIRVINREDSLTDTWSVLPNDYQPNQVQNEIGANWDEQGGFLRDRRWFVAPLSSLGGVVAAVANRLSPVRGYCLYRVPDRGNPGALGAQPFEADFPVPGGICERRSAPAATPADG